MSLRPLGAASLLVLAGAGSVSAQSRTFVATYGSDDAPCTRVAPCRSFQAAVDAVAVGGEVVVLDSGGYGRFSVAKSVTVTGNSVHAAVTVTGGTAINVDVDTGEKVTLRHLSLFGVPGALGVVANGAGAVHLDHLEVSGFAIGVTLSAAETSLADTVVSDSAGGVLVRDSKAALERVRVENASSIAFDVTTNGVAAVRDSVASGSTIGFRAFAGQAGGTPIVLSLDRCLSANNGGSISAVSQAATPTRVNVANTSMVGGSGLFHFAISGTTAEIVSFGGNRRIEITGGEGFTSTVAAE